MKKHVYCFLTVLPLLSCVRQNADEALSGNWNGYEKYLKTGEAVHTLWAGRNINVGTVTYGLDDSANFYVTYDCSSSGWKISETHMFAGDKADMPLNKPGAPKIGLFPHSGFHNPRVTTVTYRVPLNQLPPCEAPGFVVAAHCVVRSPSGQTETAWAEGDYTFSDKGWGWYDTYYYNTPANPFIILYATLLVPDSLKLYHLDVTLGTSELILSEFVGNSPGVYDGAAYDSGTGAFFFSKCNTGELWVNRLESEDPSFCAGLLAGIASAGTFHGGAFYYTDTDILSINKVTLNDDFMITDETVLDTIPCFETVNDIAVDPAGDRMFISGNDSSGQSGIIQWVPAERTFYSMETTFENGAQIAFGSDEILYAISPLFEGGSEYYIYAIDMQCDTLYIVEDEIIIMEDPFSDITGGPPL